MPCLRRPIRADRRRGGFFPLRGSLRPDRRLFLDPFKGPFALTGALTDRPPPLRGGLEALTGGLLTRRPVTGTPCPYRGLKEVIMVPFAEKDDEEAYGKAGYSKAP